MVTTGGFNPIWLIFAVNVVAAFLVPFLTYKYAHKNNLKTLRERWIAEYRAATAGYVEACSVLYYANDSRYQKLSVPSTPSEADRSAHIKRSEEGQSKVAAAWARIRLLFKEGDADFARLEPLLQSLKESVDKPTSIGTLFHMDPEAWNGAQDAFLRESNAILTTEWSKIAE